LRRYLALEATVTLKNETGLHARPAALFVSKAREFPHTRIFIRKGEREVDGRSLLSILSLGVSKGTEIVLRTEGEQEEEALKALVGLLESGLGE
jgi:phosphotransferase system HPr (HPr) family protein